MRTVNQSFTLELGLRDYFDAWRDWVFTCIMC